MATFLMKMSKTLFTLQLFLCFTPLHIEHLWVFGQFVKQNREFENITLVFGNL